jgi:hypothetical protein
MIFSYVLAQLIPSYQMNTPGFLLVLGSSNIDEGTLLIVGIILRYLKIKAIFWCVDKLRIILYTYIKLKRTQRIFHKI